MDAGHRCDSARVLWVAVLHISDRTAQKLRSKHDIEPDDVRDAVVCRPRLFYVEDIHPERGHRMIVSARIREVPSYVVLYPDDGDPFGDVWHLGSAYPLTG